MEPAYTRQTRPVRVQAFVDATIDCLAESGYHAASVRRIAGRAGVTPGLLTHYFAGKAELIAAAYRHLADLTFAHALAVADAEGADARRRLAAFVSASFGGPDLPYDIFKVWISFWALTVTEPSVAQVHAETYGRVRSELERMISDVMRSQGRSADGNDIRRLGIGANAVIDGMWLEFSLDPGTFDDAEAAAIACRMVGAVLGVDLVPPRTKVR